MSAVDVTILRLTLAPVFVGIISWASRVAGPRIGGVLMALPVNSGTALFLFSLSPGLAFATRTAGSAMLAAVSISAFAVGFAVLARRLPWGWAILGASLAFLGADALLAFVSIPVELGFVVACAVAVLGWKSLGPARRPTVPGKTKSWDIPARMVVALAVVFSVTTAGSVLGPEWSGLLIAYPVFATTVLVFERANYGPVSALSILQGLELGLLSYAAFLLCIGLLLERLGIPATFLIALGATAAVQSYLIWTSRDAGRGGTPDTIAPASESKHSLGPPSPEGRT
ncbi:MAG TPA: hypothetical protein VEK13_03730 [Thermoplasmata archaeon]|nr:hypothetical protein [Thermoplasmata archaeon]